MGGARRRSGQTLVQLVLFIGLLLLAAGIALRYVRNERVASDFSEKFGKKLTDTVEETDGSPGGSSGGADVRIERRISATDLQPEEARPGGETEPADTEYRGVERRKGSPLPKP